MDTFELQALKALAEAATPGPWVNHSGRIVSASDMDVGSAYEDDARFIAAARDAVPALIAEVERLRALVEEAYSEGLRTRSYDDETAWKESDARKALGEASA